MNIFVGKPKFTECADFVKSTLDLRSVLKVPSFAGKGEGPGTTLTFLGIEIDSVAQTLSVPAWKLAKSVDF